MKTKLSIYFLGATVVDYSVVRNVARIKNKANSVLGLNTQVEDECHITILPPFRATYEQATILNLNCSMATLVPNHPLTVTPLQIQRLSIMVWRRKSFLHFPVVVEESLFYTRDFMNYVTEIRERVLSLPYFTWESDIPPTFRPHISVLSFRGLERREGIQKLVKASQSEKPILFHVSYPTVYARYGAEWHPLSHDPTRST